MSLDLQQSLAELQTAFDSGKDKDAVTKLITQLKVSSRSLHIGIRVS